MSSVQIFVPVPPEVIRREATATDYEKMPGRLTGPFLHPLNRYKSLVAIPVGNKSKANINTIVQKFGLENFTFVLFHYDLSTWEEFPWYKDVISIRYPGNMKWFFMKRFIHPLVVLPYEYLILWDEDLSVDCDHCSFDPQGFLDIMRKYDIQIGQPSLSKGGSWLLPQLHFPNNPSEGRWTDVVECMVPVFRSDIWAECVWSLIGSDITSGWGIDLLWRSYCGLNRTAVIDKYVLHHLNYASTSSSAASSSSSTGTSFVYDGDKEGRAIVRRMLGIAEEARIMSIRPFTEKDVVTKQHWPFRTPELTLNVVYDRVYYYDD
eukprot:CAMPEP_0184659320 /NCGR_PEP_ID=MMETSP0308-20130426/29140_1 /TAXON_ID=38269 /ORGANISM="Gloeochaete witrockiana, Strain SAG 46.84" /LENGTH=319 /DNA_ID=CAMNT_0027099045 /DNA_START=561 /DNA_END=1520 /DNA_ORIENTATION=+